MKTILIFITLIIFAGCSRLEIPDSNEDPNDPNHGPILISHGEIEYPHLAHKLNIEGIVEVEILVDTSGTVEDVKILSRKFNADAVYTSGKTVYLKDIVDEPLIKFYKQCKFLPALRDGKPVLAVFHTGFQFSLLK